MKMAGKLYMKKGKVAVKLKFDPIVNMSQKLFQVTMFANQKTTYLMQQLNSNQQQTITHPSHHRMACLPRPLELLQRTTSSKILIKNFKKHTGK